MNMIFYSHSDVTLLSKKRFFTWPRFESEVFGNGLLQYIRHKNCGRLGDLSFFYLWKVLTDSFSPILEAYSWYILYT